MQTTRRIKKPEPEFVRESALLEAADDELQIDLLELFYRLLERAKYIIGVSVLCAILAAAITLICIQPMYTATSKLYVMSASDTAINLADLQMGTYLASDYQEVFRNWHVHERVLQQLNLPYSYEKLTGMLEVTNPSDTRILYINIESPDPAEAKLIADTYAAVAKEFIATTMDTKEPSLFEEALLPTSPTSPRPVRNTALGFLLGFFASCALFTIRFILDDKIRTAADVEKYFDLPVLGMMPVQNIDKPATSRKSRREGN